MQEEAEEVSYVYCVADGVSTEGSLLRIKMTP